MDKLRRVGILGGTFDPVHQGHEYLARQATDHLQLDRVVWIPTRYPPHKKQVVATYEERCVAIEKAIAAEPDFELLQLSPTTTSYGIDVFNAVQNRYPHSQYYWLLGWDSFASLPYWYQRQALIPNLIWLIAPRSDPQSPSLQQVLEQFRQQNLAVRWQMLPIAPLSISATAIRQAYQAGGDPPGLKAAVRQYIRDRGLYAPEKS